MKNKSKVRFRIGALCLIAMFLLLPMLSSPVAAVNNCTGMSVTTTCGPTGFPITISVTNPTTTSFIDDGSMTIKVTCDVTFQDLFTNTRSPSSKHDSTLWSSVKTGSGNTDSDATGSVFLDDGETDTDTLTIYLIANTLPSTWNVYLNTKVWDEQGTDELEDDHTWEISLT